MRVGLAKLNLKGNDWPGDKCDHKGLSPGRDGMQEQSKRPSVMVVDDEDELREKILVPGLGREGFAVDGVSNAIALYRALNLRSYDLFVVDIGLPDESGFAVTQHLRKLGDVGIVMLTGRRGSEDHIRGLDEGADAYLSKPVGIDVIAATLRSVLRRSSARDVGHPFPKLTTAGWSLNAKGGASRIALRLGRGFVRCRTPASHCSSRGKRDRGNAGCHHPAPR